MVWKIPEQIFKLPSKMLLISLHFVSIIIPWFSEHIYTNNRIIQALKTHISVTNLVESNVQFLSV